MSCSECTDQIRKGHRYCTVCGEHFHLLESRAKKVTDPRELGISVVSPLRGPHMASNKTTTTPAASGATVANTAASTGAATKTGSAVTVVGASTAPAASKTKSSAKATMASK